MSVKKNLVYQSVYEIMVIILPLFTSPYISRVLGAQNLGIFSYTYSIAYYFQLFAMLGIRFYGNRAIARVRDNQAQRSRVFSSILYIHIAISIVVCICYAVYVAFFVQEDQTIAWLQILTILSCVFDISWFYFGMEAFKKTVARNCLIKIISFISIFVFVQEREDLWKYTVIIAGSMLLSQILLWRGLHKYVSFLKPKWREMTEHLIPLLSLFIPVVALGIFKYMDKIMLGIMSTKVEVGLYENAEKAIQIPSSIILSFGTVMLPRISNLEAVGQLEESKRYFNLSITYMMCLAIAMAFGIGGVADVFAPVFWGSEFVRSGAIISALAVSIPFTALASIVRNQYLLPKRMDKQYAIAIVLGVLVNLILNLILIPAYQGIGAAIATVVAEVTVCIAQLMSVRKDISVLDMVQRFIGFLVPGVVMLYVVRLIKKSGLFNSQLLILFFEVLCGAAVFAVLAAIYLLSSRKDIRKKLLHKIRAD